MKLMLCNFQHVKPQSVPFHDQNGRKIEHVWFIYLLECFLFHFFLSLTTHTNTHTHSYTISIYNFILFFLLILYVYFQLLRASWVAIQVESVGIKFLTQMVFSVWCRSIPVNAIQKISFRRCLFPFDIQHLRLLRFIFFFLAENV